MNAADWNAKFGEKSLVTLTSEERRYFALNAISSEWETLVFYSKTNLWYTRVIVFFDGDLIVKTITETKRVFEENVVAYECYTESDTNLATDNRAMLLPLTSKGKPKRLTASNINAVTPFGCSFSIAIQSDRDTEIYLNNDRACRAFPLGERDKIAAIRTEEDFHAFADYYISSCRNDYFEKLQLFKSAQKVTVKYKAGDVFRMEYDRTHYCYGIITGEIKRLKAMPELPEKHSFRSLMMVPIMVRLYRVITENAELTAEELQVYPLGRVMICGDNDIIWGTHTIVDHRQLDASDLEFNFICTKILSDNPHHTLFTEDMLMRDMKIKREYQLYVEWGFAHTILQYDQLSDKLKKYLESYASPHGGVGIGIDPCAAVPDEKRRSGFAYCNNLLNPENREFLNEIFFCLGMNPDSSFDQFAQKFGGLSLQEILQRTT